MKVDHKKQTLLSRFAARYSKGAILLVATMFAVPANLSAQTGLNKVGTVGALFLKLPVGAQAAGMGAAVTGVTHDAEAAFWNPAALALQPKGGAAISLTQWLAEVNLHSFAVSRQVGGLGVFALSAIMLTTPEMAVTTTTQQDGTGESFTYRDASIGVSYARELTDHFAIGGTIKFIDQQIYTLHARSFAIDVGTYYRTGFKALRLVMTLKNFGPDMRFGGHYTDTIVRGAIRVAEERNYGAYPLPLLFTFGLASEIIERENLALTIAADALYPNDYTERLHLGAEARLFNLLAVRMGYKINYEQENFTAGAGVHLRQLAFDYAYTNFVDFTGVSTFGLIWRF